MYSITLTGIRLGARIMLPMALIVVPYGIGFGGAAVEYGFTALEATLMSIGMFTGAAQFAVIELWRQQGHLSLAILLTVVAVSARFILLGAALSPWLSHLKRSTRLLAMTTLSDPNYIDTHEQIKQGNVDFGRFVGGGAIMWLAWIIGTAVGAVLGQTVGGLESVGFDVLMLSFFAAMVTGQCRNWRLAVSMLVTGVVALLLALFSPSAWNIIFAALAGGLVGSLLYER